MIPKYLNCGNWLVPYNKHCINCGKIHVFPSATRFPLPHEVLHKQHSQLREHLAYNLALWSRSNVKKVGISAKAEKKKVSVL